MIAARRHALLAGAVAAGVLAAILYYASAQRQPVVVAAREIEATRPLEAADLITRPFPAEAVPPGALRDPGSLVGRYVRAPLGAGQLVLAGTVADGRATFASGLRPPTGMRAIAIPVTAPQALGGAVTAGSRVNVIAVPVSGKAPPDRNVETVASSALVLDVRGESGQALGRPAARAAVTDRLASIVIAIAPSQELRLAQRIPTSTFVVVLTAP